MSDPLYTTVSSVQRLVRALTRRHEEAEDVAQEAWLAAVEKGISGPSLGPWVSGAARRIVRSRRRDAARRREREERAEPALASPGAQETAARIELAKRVVAAVESLDEPYKSAVVLRYFEELPPREIARRLGIPVNTARSRVRRGIEGLRGRFDRGALLALLPLAPRETPPAAPFAAVAGRLPRWMLGAASGLLGVLVGGTYLVATSSPVGGRSAGALVARKETPDVLVAGDRGPAAPDRTPVPSSDVDAFRSLELMSGSTRSDSRAASAAKAQLPAEVRGRFLRSDGTPAAGASVRLWPAYLLGTGTLDPEVVQRATGGTTMTDAMGRFALKIELHEGVGFRLDVEVAGLAPASWAFFQLASGETHDMGEVALERGGVLAGQIIDQDGRPLPGEGRVVSALSPAHDPEGGREDVGLVSEVDPVTGAFRFEHVPTGPVELEAFSALMETIAGAEVDVATDRELRVDLVQAGPEPTRQLVVAVPDSTFWEVEDPLAAIRCLRADGSTVLPTPRSGSLSLAFDELSPGPYSVTLDDPRYLPWRQDGVQPGTRVTIELQGSSGLRIQAYAQGTEERIAHLTSVRLVRHSRDRQARVIHEGPLEFPANTLRSLVAGDFTLTVHAPGYQPSTLEIERLLPNETRTILLELPLLDDRPAASRR